MILVDEKTAVMEPADLAELPEYSWSLPTGTTIGKRWKRSGTHTSHDGWWMGEYAAHPEADKTAIIWRAIEVVR